MLLEEIFVQSENIEELKSIIKNSIGKDDKILTLISGDCGKDFKGLLDELGVKNNAIYTRVGEVVKEKRFEKELMEDEEISHVAIIDNEKLDYFPLMKMAKSFNKILINVE
ncbi:MAG: hypothetical protein ACRDD2_10205 [Sarcina sp.]